MQATARLKFLMMSPRKVRRVVSLVKGKSVEEALAILKFTNKAAAGPLAKTIESATANALAVEGTSRLKAEDLSIGQINVDEGPMAKRIQFRAMGRVYRYKKRFAHITVMVKGTPSEESPAKKKAKSAQAVKKDDGKVKAEKTSKKTVKKAAPKVGDKDKASTTKKAAPKKTSKKAVKKKPEKKAVAKVSDKSAAEKKEK
ncbi:MAG: 50S ribosomal protein L22 [FCB group bacterium]|nr:50S ribosomal protein L22 [FCB group bacterium]